jgi:hypothetical protein
VQELIVELECNGSDPVTEYAIAQAMQRAFEIFKRKHHDYGPGNISIGGVTGLIYRMMDKMMRLWSLRYRAPKVTDESIDDTCYDLLNYAAMTQAVRAGEWPQFPEWFTRSYDE